MPRMRPSGIAATVPWRYTISSSAGLMLSKPSSVTVPEAEDSWARTAGAISGPHPINTESTQRNPVTSNPSIRPSLVDMTIVSASRCISPGRRPGAT